MSENVHNRGEQTHKEAMVAKELHVLTAKTDDTSSLRAAHEFECMVSEIAASLVNVLHSEIDKLIEQKLGLVAEFLGTHLGTLLLLNEQTQRYEVTHQWKSAIAKDEVNFRGVKVDQSYPWLAQQLRDRHQLTISSLDEFSDQAKAERESCERLGIRSVLWAPFDVSELPKGFIAINSLVDEIAWNDLIVQRMRLVGEILGHALSHHKAARQIEKHQQFERLLAELSTTFISLPVAEIDGQINDSLRIIGEVMEVDRIFLNQFSKDKSEFRVTHMWTADGVPRDGFVFDVDLGEYALWYTKKMLSGKPLIFSSVNEIPKEAVNEREYVKQTGIKSSAIVPLTVNESVFGNFGFDMIHNERQWSESLLRQLQLASDIFGNALKRKEADQNLHAAYAEISQLQERLAAENVVLREKIALHGPYSQIIGVSDPIKQVLAQTKRVAPTNATVLLLGETGTGKELLAHEIHELSLRKDRPMITVNCAALPASLVEAELFGREKGAYTGAMDRQIGRFEIADGSTIFLDEIGELSTDLQMKFLRVLQEGEVERLGSAKTINVDVRVIAASNRDLIRAMEDGEFREDLFYRLNVFPITVPSLRDRVDDIAPMVTIFVKQFGARMGKRIEHISKDTMSKLESYPWPGNVRELKNVLERAVILATDSTLRVDLPQTRSSPPDWSMSFAEAERHNILRALEKTNWQIGGSGGAADMLGLKRTTLRSKMNKLGIIKPR
ncbi:MAG: sigma 54-interacting transcriptional regulator [Gammaproteobacteria bacterium]|nr:sigma 54-interacting transcriptional regulator [Gammaproteobacteria bacterium]MDH3466084.1 sigma 54-interacting transcriptional regulator [Gammaproteobacteria bacterium]